MLKWKLRKCSHENASVFRYIRDDGNYFGSLEPSSRTYLRFCMDCGSTKIYDSSEFPHEVKWLAPWLWRSKGGTK